MKRLILRKKSDLTFLRDGGHRHVGFIDVSRLREDEGADILILEASVVNEHFHSWCILGK